jgi:hypothetical protein
MRGLHMDCGADDELFLAYTTLQCNVERRVRPVTFERSPRGYLGLYDMACDSFLSFFFPWPTDIFCIMCSW